MYLKYSSFKSIALLLALCFTFLLVLPTFTPKQEAEACWSEWWEAITQSAAGSAAYNIVKEVKKKITGHKEGVDSNGSHSQSDHIITTQSGTGNERYKCNACESTDNTKSNLENDAHRFMFTCDGNDDIPGCKSDVYQCHSDKEKHNQIKYCSPCSQDYRVCVGGHDDCGNSDGTCSCCETGENNCICTECSCEYCTYCNSS